MMLRGASPCVVMRVLLLPPAHDDVIHSSSGRVFFDGASMWLACRFAFVQRFLPRSRLMVMFSLVLVCEREGIVGGDEGPVGGVAQVVSHGVKVVGVHGEEGQEKTRKCGER